jgi:cytoskeleton protein RodZ
MDYKELGAYLKQERENKGLSLEDIQQKTKIGISSLEAIEAGRVNELPHPVYAKGFIKNYAQCLGLDAEEWAGTFAQKAGIDEELEDDAEDYENDFTPSRKRNNWPLISILVSIVLLVVVAWLAYDLFWVSADQGQDGQPANSETLDQSRGSGQGLEDTDSGHRRDGQVEEMSESTTGSEGMNGSPYADQESIAQLQDNEDTALHDSAQALNGGMQGIGSRYSGQGQDQEKNPAESRSIQGAQEVATEGGSTEQAGQSAQTTAENGRHELQVQATEACWMSAKIDSKQRDIYLRPGESVTLRFARRLDIKLGNAGGVSLAYDGQTYPLEADSGDVLSLTFP